MKVLFDTNVWLDIILSREGFWEASLTALYDCIDEDDDLCVIATSLKDVFFLVERLKDANVAYESVERMLELARPIAVDEAVCRRALPLERPDYEDGIIAAAAEIEQIECIVTRDEGRFSVACALPHRTGNVLSGARARSFSAALEWAPIIGFLRCIKEQLS